MLVDRQRVLVPLVLIALLSGCAATRPSNDWKSVEGSGTGKSLSGTEQLARAKASAHLDDSAAIDLARLRRIYDSRAQTGAHWDYPIGTGDLIEISVPSMQELEEETVRVSSSGTVSLPMLGDVRASGLTEKQFKAEVRRKLSQYMHDPRVSVHVAEYRSRQVGVLGAVDEPGLHNAGGADSTILDMISEAGGLTDDATQRLLFIPVEEVGPEEANELALDGLISKEAGAGDIAGLQSDPLLKAADPIVIDLEKMNRRSARFALAVPVRPGDTIMALGGGQVFVQGWVEEPGSQPMTRGLTLLGAIAGAGGTSFPAKKSTVQVLRDSSSNGAGKARIARTVNLNDIEEGRAEDIPLREGDLVIVEAEGVRLVGYGVYQFFTNVMRVGVSLASPF